MSEIFLFLDDCRNPEMVYPSLPATTSVVVVRSYAAAVEYVEKWGCPTTVSFDHDLGDIHAGVDEKTGYSFALYLVDRDLDSAGNFLPPNFKFYVHSANPIGAAKISELLNSYLRFR